MHGQLCLSAHFLGILCLSCNIYLMCNLGCKYHVLTIVNSHVIGSSLGRLLADERQF